MAAPPATVRRLGVSPGLQKTPGVRALALIEGRRLLARPSVLGGVVLSLLAMVTSTWSVAPVLNRDDVTATGALLVASAATLLAANLAVLRSRSHGTDELLRSMPVPARARTLATMIAVAGPAALAGVCAGGFLLWRAADSAVTAPDPFEVAAGPVLVALGGCLGIALARWLPSTAVAPVVVVGLAALEFAINVSTTGIEWGGRVKWLAPFVGQQGVARELLVRPTGWHLVYLSALVAAVACLALLRHPGATRSTITAITLAVTVLVAAGAAQLRPLDAARQPAARAAQLAVDARQDCQRRGSVTYCALPAYRPWIGRWAAVVEPVLARLPADVRVRPLTIRQDVVGTNLEFLGGREPDRSAAPSRSQVRPGLWWGRGAGEGRYQFGLALGVASLAVGLSPDGAAAPDGGLQSCTAAGQGRAVVAMWLAGHASDQSARYLRATVAALPSDSAEIYFDGPHGQPVGSLQFGAGEAVAALPLLERPRAQVADLVDRHWDVLTDPATSTDRAVRLLELDDRPAIDHSGAVDPQMASCP